MRNAIYLIIIGFGLIGSQVVRAQAQTDYAELTDTKPHDSDAVWDKLPAAPQMAWGSTDVRYAKRNVPILANEKTLGIRAWRGERINAQAVVWTRREIAEARITVSDLTCGTSVIPSSNASPAFVRYVMTDELNKDGRGACGGRENRSEWDSSMVADMLYKPELQQIEARTTQPVWLSLDVPRETKPGIYKGVITVSGKNCKSMRLHLAVTVLNRTLPATKEWAFHLDLWQNPYAVARYYNVPLWSKAHFDAMRPTMQRLADAGQKVITASVMYMPWNGQTEDHFDSMITKTKKIDGTWAYDYTVFDAWVEFMISLGIDRQINCYTLIPWALRFDYFDQATGRIQFLKAKPGDEAYAAYWGSFLKDFATHLRTKGWFDRTTIAMDERGLDAMREAIKVIRAADADFKISLAGNYHDEIEPELYDYCLAYGQDFPDDVRAKRNRQGKVSTVYTCCTEARPNTFTFSPPAEAAWIGWHVAAARYDGYLRWAYNSWTADPLRDSRFRTWAAGDCYLVYPAYSSIRMERLAEGIQDCEKIRLLRQEFAARQQSQNAARLDALLAPFSAESIWKTDAATTLNAARKALNNF